MACWRGAAGCDTDESLLFALLLLTALLPGAYCEQQYVMTAFLPTDKTAIVMALVCPSVPVDRRYSPVSIVRIRGGRACASLAPSIQRNAHRPNALCARLDLPMLLLPSPYLTTV